MVELASALKPTAVLNPLVGSRRAPENLPPYSNWPQCSDLAPTAECRVWSFLVVSTTAGSAACSVVRQRTGADSRVAAYGIGKECLMTDRGIVVAGGVKEQGRNANTGVETVG
jgi:hypothetical protein